jgi:hypothetical protein
MPWMCLSYQDKEDPKVAVLYQYLAMLTLLDLHPASTSKVQDLMPG